MQIALVCSLFPSSVFTSELSHIMRRLFEGVKEKLLYRIYATAGELWFCSDYCEIKTFHY